MIPFKPIELIAALPKIPIDKLPQSPPIKWMPTTSSESSKLNLYFKPTANAQRTPESKPITTAAHGATNAQAGVIATKPETAPDATPNEVG